jgi:hypothetical protein
MDLFCFKQCCNTGIWSRISFKVCMSKQFATLAFACWRCINWFNLPPRLLFETLRSQTTQIHSPWVPVSLKSPLAEHAHFVTVCADLRQYVRRSASMHSHPASVVHWRWLTHPQVDFEINALNNSNRSPVVPGNRRNSPIFTLTEIFRK